MTMEVLMDFIKPELIVLIPVLYFIGHGIRNSKVDNKFIPISLGLIGIVLSVIYVAATTAGKYSVTDILLITFTGVTQGILAAGASVYIDQLNKQSKK